jgi:hypothetical protein
VANVERQITNDARRQSEHAADTLRSISRREILWAERSPAQAYKDILKSSEVYKNDSCKINLLNDASEYTEKEIERIIEPFTKAARSRIDRAFSKRSESTQKLLRTDLTREFATANAKREIKELEQQMGGEIPDRKARFQDLYDGEMRRLSLTDAYNKELNTYLARPFKEAFANAKNNRYVLIEGEMQKLDNFIAKKIDIAVKRSEAYAKDRLHKDEKLLQDQVERDAERELEELGDALDPKLIQAEMDAREKARKAVRKSENGAEDAVDDLV